MAGADPGCWLYSMGCRDTQVRTPCACAIAHVQRPCVPSLGAISAPAGQHLGGLTPRHLVQQTSGIHKQTVLYALSSWSWQQSCSAVWSDSQGQGDEVGTFSFHICHARVRDRTPAHFVCPYILLHTSATIFPMRILCWRCSAFAAFSDNLVHGRMRSRGVLPSTVSVPRLRSSMLRRPRHLCLQ